MSTANLSDVTLRDTPEAVADAIITGRGLPKKGKPLSVEESKAEFFEFVLMFDRSLRPRLAAWLEAFHAHEAADPDGKFEREFLIEQAKAMQAIVADNHRLQTARN